MKTHRQHTNKASRSVLWPRALLRKVKEAHTQSYNKGRAGYVRLDVDRHAKVIGLRLLVWLVGCC